MPKIHERYFVVKNAELELSAFLIELEQKHDLTFAEMFKLLGVMIERESKYAIRAERHPDDPDKKGDEE